MKRVPNSGLWQKRGFVRNFGGSSDCPNPCRPVLLFLILFREIVIVFI